MKTSIIILVASAVTMLSGVTVHAGLLDFTLGDAGQNTQPLPASYQPISGVTVGYSNISSYNAAADHTSGLAGTNNYFTYPSSGDTGTMTFTFSSDVAIPSFWYDTFHDTAFVTVHAYDSSNTDLTGGGINLTPPPHGDSAPVFALSTALAGLTTIRTLTFSTPSDAANIDDIRVIATPEPSSLILCGLGAAGLIAAVRRRRRA